MLFSPGGAILEVELEGVVSSNDICKKEDGEAGLARKKFDQ